MTSIVWSWSAGPLMPRRDCGRRSPIASLRTIFPPTSLNGFPNGSLRYPMDTSSTAPRSSIIYKIVRGRAMTDPQLVLSAARLRLDPATGKRSFAVRVANRGSAPAHVWATPTAMTYSPATQTLHVTLAQASPQPGFEQTQHPRIPAQLVVGPERRRDLHIDIPAVIRALDFTNAGLAPTLVETAVGPITMLNLEIAYADTPFQPLTTLPPREFAAALAAHGGRITVGLPIATKERTN